MGAAAALSARAPCQNFAFFAHFAIFALKYPARRFSKAALVPDTPKVSNAPSLREDVHNRVRREERAGRGHDGGERRVLVGEEKRNL